MNPEDLSQLSTLELWQLLRQQWLCCLPIVAVGALALINRFRGGTPSEPIIPEANKPDERGYAIDDTAEQFGKFYAQGQERFDSHNNELVQEGIDRYNQLLDAQSRLVLIRGTNPQLATSIQADINRLLSQRWQDAPVFGDITPEEIIARIKHHIDP